MLSEKSWFRLCVSATGQHKRECALSQACPLPGNTKSREHLESLTGVSATGQHHIESEVLNQMGKF
jgi:hypothetical protein